jgi:N-acetylneuraminic acid mutarotase
MLGRWIGSLAVGLLVALGAAGAALPVVGSWATTGSMAVARGQGFTLTRLGDGRILVAGGLTGPNTATETAEIYDPSTGVWTPTGEMLDARSRHTAVLLANGKVMVIGGLLSSTGQASALTEVYDPAIGSWSAGPSMHVPRHNFTATRLNDGRILVTGGVTVSGQPGAGNIVTKTTEIFDPGTGVWSRAASMANQRYVHRASLLQDGRVLVTGGSGVTIHCMMRDTAEVYDPSFDEWAGVASMTVARSTHLSRTLPNGEVLVAGGWSLPVAGCGKDAVLETGTDVSELFDPGTGSWSASGNLAARRGNMHDAQLLDGRVLVASGRVESPGQGTVLTAAAELYDPASGAWSSAGSMSSARSGHVLVTLANGGVLVAGGANRSGPLASVEIYTP